MSSIKSELVSQTSLGEIAAQIGLGKLLRMGHGEEKSGGAKRSSNLADAFEAVTAAIYLQCGLSVARQFLLRCFGSQLDGIFNREGSSNFKSRLQELIQQKFAVLPIYEPLSSSGPSHNPTHIVRVLINGKEYAQGSGSSYKKAEQEAAQSALRKLLGKTLKRSTLAPKDVAQPKNMTKNMTSNMTSNTTINMPRNMSQKKKSGQIGQTYRVKVKREVKQK